MKPALLELAKSLRDRDWPLRLVVLELLSRGHRTTVPTLHRRLRQAGYVYLGKRGRKKKPPKPKSEPRPPRNHARDMQIRVQRAAGWTIQALAAEYGVSRQRIEAIVKSPLDS